MIQLLVVLQSRPNQNVRLVNDMRRVCSHCEAEFRVINNGPDVSHGFCKRHFMDVLASTGLSREEIMDEVLKVELNPDPWCPDMSNEESFTI